jgi:hypothetical protein
MGREITMDRYTRRVQFDRWCALRETYAALDASDTTPIISIADVIAWATHELEADDVMRFVAEETKSDAA